MPRAYSHHYGLHTTAKQVLIFIVIQYAVSVDRKKNMISIVSFVSYNYVIGNSCAHKKFISKVV